MKSSFCLLLFLHLFNSDTSSQGFCTNVVISPSVTPPSQASIVNSTCSTLVVKWQGSPNQTYCVSATYFNTEKNKTDTAVGTNITCDGSQSCTATIPVISGTHVIWSVQAISNGALSYAETSVLRNPIPPCPSSEGNVSICGKVLLQGAYSKVTNQMRNSLNTLGILDSFARKQPYSIAPFNYPGTDSVAKGFFAGHKNIVDWVLVELRDANAPSSIIASRPVFVTQDGTLVDTNGVTPSISFAGVAPAKYIIAVRHRNHLGVRSSYPVDLNCNSCYDFTLASFQSFRQLENNYPSPAQMGTAWVMRGGDANHNQNTRYTGIANDQNQILNLKLDGSLSKILSNVYAPEDVNMDGIIKWVGPKNDQNFLLNISLGGLLSIVFNEQL